MMRGEIVDRTENADDINVDGKNMKYVLRLYVTGMTDPELRTRYVTSEGYATRSSRGGTSLRSLTFTSSRSLLRRSRSSLLRH